MKHPYLFAGIVCASATVGGAAQAASLFSHGYELTLDGSGEFGFNAPRLGLTNIGDAEIVSLVVALGNTEFNFDAVVDPVADGVNFVVAGPDNVNNGVRSDQLEVDYTSFGLDDSWSALVDLDADDFDSSVGSIEDARLILFGGQPASVNVMFEDGFELTANLPSDFTEDPGEEGIDFGIDGDVYRFAQFIEVDDGGGGIIIPTPGAALAGLTLLSGLVATRRRGRR